MAKPIKETPVLTGMDAVKFRQQMNKNKTKVITAAERQTIKQNFERFKAMADFSI